ncbi:MAG: AAA family ATPase [Nitrosopumilaceae archaeon]|jgi:predicted ATP-dependent endonuclease of OLD family|uniref:AAA family ATPase n=3 Tax=Candidatus Nitrosomaritimum aestuariumsis TaxID=3342354 RepID=A0AC60W345_9ARCH|nr:AAA family ATPase [Nitrosopumilaceae archaeon]MBA4454013.1 AAA family ATPase [Nitrosopumilaceae archaeon]MBA4459722.1 AAA family ATPase [Nitrosopumilaceae archaeon]MBA4462976.1 AAA family ATPase [Nitrosopumilaceae archaeon]
MRLRKFRVRAYRCIHDSGEITVGDLAAFVGRNESGKTTILQALTLLNKDERVSELDLCDEMSEELKEEIHLAEGEFELSSNETSIIKEKFPNLPEIKKLNLFRSNKKPGVQYTFDNIKVSEKSDGGLNSWENFTKRILDFLDTIPNHLRIQINTKFFEEAPPKNQVSFDTAFAEFNNQFHVIAMQDPKVIEEWEKIYSSPENQFSNLLSGGSEKTALENFIASQLHPRFVYFSDYKKIYGNINLNEYIREEKGERGESIEYIEEFDKAETVRNLFYLAELDINELEEVKDSPSRCIKLLNAASNRLTRKLNPAWKGDPIHVDLRYNPGNIMSVVISDVHRDGTVTNTGLLNRRAEGFKWTFSFIVNFAAETQRAELKEAILLLDEPARNLHPTQQMGISDLLKSLAGSNQVLYATHSPFMIFDYTPGNLLVVELDKRKHLSRIFYDYWNADDKTLTPILYGLSRGLVESITDREIGTNSRPVIIVETMSDSMYLNSFDKFLQDPNISMNPLNIVAAYNKNAVLPLAIFYRNHGYNTFILLDNTEESKQISSQLASNEFSPIQTIFFEKEGKTIESIEDYLVLEDYLYAVNQTYEIKLRHEGYSNLNSEDVTSKEKKGVLENLRAIWDDHKEDDWNEFDNEEITRYICEKITLGETDFLSDKTKDQFRSLYRLIAERIRQYQNAAIKTDLDKFQKPKNRD